jgi:hypothetical protein
MSPLEALAKSVAETGDIVHQTYAHMEAAAAAGLISSDAPPPGAVLFSLLVDILPDRLDDLEPIDIEMAARVLERVGDAMEEQLFFLPLDGAPELN